MSLIAKHDNEATPNRRQWLTFEIEVILREVPRSGTQRRIERSETAAGEGGAIADCEEAAESAEIWSDAAAVQAPCDEAAPAAETW